MSERAVNQYKIIHFKFLVIPIDIFGPMCYPFNWKKTFNMIIQLHGKEADDYRGWLALYERLSGKTPTHRERTEAFFCAREGTKPYWANINDSENVYALNYLKGC
jgi:hypothetical protein